jgi:chromosome segregation ATPase
MQKIMAVARKHKNWALATLAVHVRLDAFKKVIEAMDKMTAELKSQQKEEAEKKDFCTKQIDEKEDLIKVEQQTKEDLDGKHKDLVSTVAGLQEEVDVLKNEVAEAEVSLKRAGEDRKAANKLYQTSMSDQRATIQILNMALNRLKEFYAPKSAVLASVSEHSQAPPPPPTPSSTGYEKSASSGGVLQLLNKIISDAEATEAELKMTEQQAQEEYASFVSATTTSIEADRASIVEKEKQIASSNSEKSYTEEAQLANKEELEKLSDLLKATHLDCDWLVKYYDIRQTARAEELDAIAEAKAILSGANFS